MRSGSKGLILTPPVQTRSPQALLLDILRREGLAAAANLLLHFVSSFLLKYYICLHLALTQYQDVTVIASLSSLVVVIRTLRDLGRDPLCPATTGHE